MDSHRRTRGVPKLHTPIAGRHDGPRRDQMDFKQLRAVVTVAETGSVSKASQLLHVVQPAVSRQVSSLEKDLGIALFERTHQGMRPTPAGAAFIARARRILTELERARAEARPTPGEVTGIATVGLLGSVERL